MNCSLTYKNCCSCHLVLKFQNLRTRRYCSWMYNVSLLYSQTQSLFGLQKHLLNSYHHLKTLKYPRNQQPHLNVRLASPMSKLIGPKIKKQLLSRMVMTSELTRRTTLYILRKSDLRMGLNIQ